MDYLVMFAFGVFLGLAAVVGNSPAFDVAQVESATKVCQQNEGVKVVGVQLNYNVKQALKVTCNNGANFKLEGK